mmetsp:Transcript_6867/g.25321  ORF Transcript_6867/g.25321 Transcript_6867/m.25321 type:complete len:422 (-) Transcript_6867:127-1392(-)
MRYGAFWLVLAVRTVEFASLVAGDTNSTARFCILDTPDLSTDEFVRRLDEAYAKRALWSFLPYDRDTGQPALQGMLHLRSNCPRFPQKMRADWGCIMTHANGLLKFEKPFQEVRSIWLSQFTLGVDSTVSELAPVSQLERRIFTNGEYFPGICKHGCDCSPMGLKEKRHERRYPTRLCFANDLVTILNALGYDQWSSQKGTLTLIMTDTDDPLLSQVRPHVERMINSGWFERIFVETKDVHIDGTETVPKGLDMHYLLGREHLLYQAVREARIDNKYKFALGAWGKRGSRTSHTKDALELEAFIDRQLRTKHYYIHRRMIGVQDYFSELSKYKFMVAPRGNGFQSPKFLEAVLVLTIPVTIRYPCFEDLERYGFPIVLVDSWSELSYQFLFKEWKRLSPLLERARWTATVEGFNSLLYGRC